MVDRPRLRSAWWAAGALRGLRRPSSALCALPPPPPDLDDDAQWGVRVMLRLGRATCLERSRILQAWEVAHGRLCDVVIGVSRPSDGFKAHAWLARRTSSAPPVGPFEELARLPGTDTPPR
ncbi:MAG: lasso peptide biosynthesis B2 protein [Actinomycetota bacterium]